MRAHVPGLGGGKFVLDAAEAQRAADYMRRGSLDSDINRYVVGMLHVIGERAKYLARASLGNANGSASIGTVALTSAMLRKSPGRRTNVGALVDTGEMRRGIAFKTDPATRTVTIGVQGPHAAVAMMHEAGYVFTITEAMAHRFRGYAAEYSTKSQSSAEKGDTARAVGHDRSATGWGAYANWAMANVGETIQVPARPFLSRAVEDAFLEFTNSASGHVTGSLARIWMDYGTRGKIIGRTFTLGLKSEAEQEPSDWLPGGS